MDYRDFKHNVYVCGVRENGRIDHFAMPKGCIDHVTLAPYVFAYSENDGNILKSCTLKYKGKRRAFELDRAMELAHEMVETLEAMQNQ